jgi:hypothetical protein
MKPKFDGVADGRAFEVMVREREQQVMIVHLPEMVAVGNTRAVQHILEVGKEKHTLQAVDLHPNSVLEEVAN